MRKSKFIKDHPDTCKLKVPNLSECCDDLTVISTDGKILAKVIYKDEVRLIWFTPPKVISKI